MKAGQKRKGSKLAVASTVTKSPPETKRKKLDGKKPTTPKKKSPKSKTKQHAVKKSKLVEPNQDVVRPAETPPSTSQAIRLQEAIEEALLTNNTVGETAPSPSLLETFVPGIGQNNRNTRSKAPIRVPKQSASASDPGSVVNSSQCDLCGQRGDDDNECKTIVELFGDFSDVVIATVEKAGKTATRTTLVCSGWCGRLFGLRVDDFKYQNEKVDVTKNLEKQIETLLKGQANLKQEMLLVRKEKVALESDLAAAKESAVASKEKLRVEAETNSAKLKADLDEQIRAVSRLEQQGQSLKVENERLVAQLDTVKKQHEGRGKRSDESEKVASLIIENQTLRQRVDTSDGDRQQVEEELKSVKQQLEQAEETSKNYYTLFDGDNALSSNKDLAEYHKMLKSDLEAKRMSMRNLLSTRYELSCDYQKVNSEKRDLEEKQVKLEDQVSALNIEVARLKASRWASDEALVKERGKRSEQVADHKNEIAKLSQQLSTCISNHEQTNQEIKTAHQDEVVKIKKAHAEELQLVRNELKEVTDRHEKFVVKFDYIEKRIFSVAIDFAETMRDLEIEPNSVPEPSEGSRIVDKMFCLEELIQVAAENLQAKLDEIKALKAKAASNSDSPELKNLQLKFDQIVEEKSVLQTELATLRQDISISRDSTDHMKASLDETTVKLQQSIQDLTESQSRETKLKSDLSELNEASNDLKVELELKRSQADDLEGRCNQLVEEGKNLQKRLASETERADRTKAALIDSIKNSCKKTSNSSAEAKPSVKAEQKDLPVPSPNQVQPSDTPVASLLPSSSTMTSPLPSEMPVTSTVPSCSNTTVTSSTLDPNLMTPDVDRMHDLFEECLQRFDDENDRNLLKSIVKEYTIVFLKIEHIRDKMTSARSYKYLQRTQDHNIKEISCENMQGKEWLLKLVFCEALWQSHQFLPSCATKVMDEVQAHLLQNC